MNTAMTSDVKDYISLLEKCPLFDGIESGNIGAMMNCTGCFTREYKKNDMIYLSSESVQCTGLILEGSVHMLEEDVWGNKSILARIEDGGIFGETFACGTDTSAIVSFQAATNSRILFMPFHKIMHTCTNSCEFHHKMVENMVRIMADKNQQLMQKLEILSKRSLRRKILAYLSSQAQENSSAYFEIPLGRIELADYLCTDRSALTRELALMKEDGLIDYDRNTFHLLNTDDKTELAN